MRLSQRQIVYLLCCMIAHDDEGNFLDPLGFAEGETELKVLRTKLIDALLPENVTALKEHGELL